MNNQKINSYLLKVITIGLFAVLFLPLVMNSHFFFPFIVFKNVLFRIIVEIIFGSYVILAIFNPKYRPKWDKITKLVLAFFGVSFIAAIFGIGFKTSIFGNYERMSGLFHHLHLVLYFIVLINTIKVKKDWNSLFTFSIFTATVMSWIGFFQWFDIPFLLKSSGGERISGTLGNATFLATYLLFNIFFLFYFLAKENRLNLKLFAKSFLALDIYLVVSSILSKLSPTADWGSLSILKAPVLSEALKFPKMFLPFIIFQLLVLAVWFLRERKNSIRILLVTVFLLNFFVFFNTQTRGAILGLVVGLGIMALASVIFTKDKRVKIAGGICLALIIISPFILLGLKDTSLVKNNGTLTRLAGISLSDITTESRLLTWKASWQGWSETPKSFLIGYGPENYYYAFNSNFPEQIFKDAGSRIWFDRAHNIVFDVAVTTGLVGLVNYFAILGFAIFALIKIYKRDSLLTSSWLFVGLVAAYFIQNFFVFDTLSSEILWFLVLGFIIFKYSEGESEQVSEKKQSAISLLIIAPVVLVVGSLLLFNINTLYSNQLIYKALVESGENSSPDKRFDLLSNALDRTVIGKFEVRQQLSNFALGLRGSPQVSQKFLSEVVNYTVEEFNSSIRQEPKNVRHYLWLATLYNGMAFLDPSNPDKAISMLDEAEYLSPSRSHLFFERGQSYILKNDFQSAFELFQEGVDLAPWVRESHFYLLSLAIASEHDEVVDREFKVLNDMGWIPGERDYLQLINLYNRRGLTEKLIPFYEGLISLHPQDSKYYAQLAAVYARLGNNQEAKDLTKKAVDLDASFSQEAVKFLELLERGELKDK